MPQYNIIRYSYRVALAPRMKVLGDDLEIRRPILRLLGAPERGNDERRRGPDSTLRVGHDPEGRPRCIHVALVDAERFHDLARDTETWSGGRRHGAFLRQTKTGGIILGKRQNGDRLEASSGMIALMTKIPLQTGMVRESPRSYSGHPCITKSAPK